MKYTFLFFLIIIFVLTGCQQTTPPPSPSSQKKEIIEEKLIAEAKTELLDKTENRINNITLASDSLNGYSLPPGEIFSFNQVVGERTEDKGYKKAPVLLYEEREYDYGGGVCQVSSTIFQAARNAGLEITERHAHKKEVNYAKSGDDAAVDYDTLDLKFVNNTDNEIIIYTSVDENYVYSKISLKT